MKFLTGLGLSLCMLLTLPAFAQDAREGNIRFKKADRNGVMADYDAPKGTTEDALAQTLEPAKLGRRHSESSFWKYEGVTWTDISPDKIDVYFNVEHSKDKSTVYMLVSTGYDNFVTTASNPQVIQNMKTFLTKFNDNLKAYQAQLALAEQQKVVKDADKDLKRADHETDRAARRQRKADKEKAERQQQADEEKKKLDELQKAVH